ncbi:hypothetical protein [Streptomyces sp. NPDC005438]|uniref:hypothetical protein n=1 Tax=Streptomyces sp. NPDC005438 TaxID=3156880 RepID=UPI0033A7D4FE
MIETTALTTAAERLADRLRAMPHSRLRRGAAAQGLALARELADRAQLLEWPEREPLTMPDAGPFAVGDQLSVAAGELASALDRYAPPPRAEDQLAWALRRVAEVGRDCH